MYEKEILKNLLISVGLNHKIDDRIKPSKHPNMMSVEKALKKHKVNYTYFPFTDSLAVTQTEVSEHTSLCHTLMMPSTMGISIVVIINSNKEVEEVLEEMCVSLDKIIPHEISYDIVGINQ
tara:strand:- start:394 stop:756 length:363 start_codon:yes stop_codon:yes gene_type:complete